jgi:hypothetical protein
VENFLACHDRGVEAHMPDLQGFTAKRIEKLNIFSRLKVPDIFELGFSATGRQNLTLIGNPHRTVHTILDDYLQGLGCLLDLVEVMVVSSAFALS